MFQFSGCRSLTLRSEFRRMTGGGLPHSEIFGSRPVCGSPKLIAAYHVLHRLLVPSHPPLALGRLTTENTFLLGVSLLHPAKGGFGTLYMRCDLNLNSCQRTKILLSGDDRDRTGDLLLAKQALSQLSYVPSRWLR